MRKINALAVVMSLLFSVSDASAVFGDRYNGFDVSESLIPKDEILRGGPPRDGIPAILEPKFTDVEDAGWLKDDDLVTGIIHDGTAKAYPLRILVWHEAVNDEIKGVPVLVSYCPLCGSTLTFKRVINDELYTFGISGLLYQSDVLFYDHQTESLWSQLEMKAVTGEMAGTDMEIFPSVLAKWGDWKKRHPDSLVLSRDTGFARDYSRDPYTGYESSRSIMFPVNHKSDRLHPKERVLVVVSGESAKAYPFSELEKADSPFEDKVGEKSVIINFEDGGYVSATDFDKNPVDSFVSFWFAWYTFKPDTEVFELN